MKYNFYVVKDKFVEEVGLFFMVVNDKVVI